MEMAESQKSVFGSSLSLPSEPAGVKNWFSSDSCDAYFRDSVLEEDAQGEEVDDLGNHPSDTNKQLKRVGDILPSGEVSNEIDKCMFPKFSAADDDGKGEGSNGGADDHLHDDEVFGSHSLSLPSEPAGIQNWFSSEDCDAYFVDSVLEEGAKGEEEDDLGNNIRGTNKQLKRLGNVRLNGDDSNEIDKCMVIPTFAAADDDGKEEINGGVDDHLHDDEVLGSHSLSLPSEPAGIQNWFSSDDCDAFFGDSILEEDVQGEEEDNLGIHLRDTNKQLKRVGDVLLKRDDSNEMGKCMVFSKFAAADDHLRDDEDTRLEEVTEASFSFENVLLRAKDCTVPTMNNKRSSEKEGCNSKNVLSSSKRDNDQQMINGSPRRPFVSPKDTGSHSSVQRIRVTEGKECTVPAINNRKSRDKKSLCSKNREDDGSLRGEHMAANRRPFSETSNLSPFQNLEQKAGKWHCPRKFKTNLGPPMKQLRLEQWVRRIESKSMQHIR